MSDTPTYARVHAHVVKLVVYTNSGFKPATATLGKHLIDTDYNST